jgi:hypothetical protein
MVKVMESGQGSLDDLCSALGGCDARAFVRVAVQAGSHAVWYVDATVGPPSVPTGWQPMVWEYDSAIFIAAETSVKALTAALKRDDAQVLPLGCYNLTLPVLAGHLTWQRRPSRARYDSVRLPWPATIFTAHWPGNAERQTPGGYLIGDDCPSFPSYEAALRAFFYADYARSSASGLPSGFGDIRVVEAAAWFERVIVTPTSLEIQVGGHDMAGARVELNGATYRIDARVNETGQVQLPLPEGLPTGSWLYLSRDRRWLDYRPLGDYRAQTDYALAGVEVELPQDPDAEIQALLAQGEGQQVEFKRQLPEESPDSKRTVFKTVAAFANGAGGSIVFGVEKDEATICGLDGINPLKERDRLVQLARSLVTPSPAVEVRQYDVDGKVLMVLIVEPGSNRPYGITLPGKKDKPVEFYVRRDATTFPARPEEIRNAVLETVPPVTADPGWYGSG